MKKTEEVIRLKKRRNIRKRKIAQEAEKGVQEETKILPLNLGNFKMTNK